MINKERKWEEKNTAIHNIFPVFSEICCLLFRKATNQIVVICKSECGYEMIHSHCYGDTVPKKSISLFYLLFEPNK